MMKTLLSLLVVVGFFMAVSTAQGMMDGNMIATAICVVSTATCVLSGNRLMRDYEPDEIDDTFKF